MWTVLDKPTYTITYLIISASADPNELKLCTHIVKACVNIYQEFQSAAASLATMTAAFSSSLSPISTMKPISLQKRREALQLLKNGLSTRQIAQQVGISKYMASKIRKAAPTELPTPKSGRKKKLNHLHTSWINQYIRRNPKTTLRRACQDVFKSLKIKLAPSTLRKALLFNHFKARKN